jgi:copper homeostasis protein
MEPHQLQRDSFRIEICANSVESCIEAEKGGADRVELCADIPEGGTTPSYGEIMEARKSINIKLHVIIRPRGGDFLYSPQELNIMQHDISMANELGADGVVFGCLTNEGEIGVEACLQLLEVTSGMSVTFHRAFDCCRNPQQALEQLIALHFDRILTSGQQLSAENGILLLKDLHNLTHGRIKLLAGCEVNESNIVNIYQQTNIHEFHFSARQIYKSKMNFFNRHVFMGDKNVDEYSREVTSAQKVQHTIEILLNSIS